MAWIIPWTWCYRLHHSRDGTSLTSSCNSNSPLSASARIETRQLATWVDYMSKKNRESTGEPAIWTMGMSGTDPGSPRLRGRRYRRTGASKVAD
jgi:hypothetical protein